MTEPHTKEEIIELIRTAAENEQKIEKFKSIIVELKGLYEEKLQKILGELKRFSKENQNLTEELKSARMKILELEKQGGGAGGAAREPSIEDLPALRIGLQKMDDGDLRGLAAKHDIEVEDGWNKNAIIDAILLSETGVDNAEVVALADDIVQVLRALDAMMENLPEDTVKEFASSKEFALYDRICERLKV